MLIFTRYIKRYSNLKTPSTFLLIFCLNIRLQFVYEAKFVKGIRQIAKAKLWAVRNPDFFLLTVCSVGKNLQNLEILIEKTNPDIFV